MTTRSWVKHAVHMIDADFNRSADTHLTPLSLPAFPAIDFYLKDESSHPTGNLRHRLARSLFLYALCNGCIRDKSTVIDASSESTGTIFSTALPLADEMRAKGETGSVVAILCDGGGRYLHRYDNDAWVEANGFDIGAPLAEIQRFCQEAPAPSWPLPVSRLD